MQGSVPNVGLATKMEQALMPTHAAVATLMAVLEAQVPCTKPAAQVPVAVPKLAKVIAEMVLKGGQDNVAVANSGT